MKRWVALAGFGLLITSCVPALSNEELKQRVEAVFEIPTVEMLFREVVYHRSDDQFLIFRFNRRETLFRVMVRVQAGFDLSRGYNVEWSDGALHVTLPPPEILSTDADDLSLHEYFSDGQNIGYLRLQAVLGERAEAVGQAALRMGILHDASRYARERLSNTFQALGVEKWEVSVRSGNQEADLENP